MQEFGLILFTMN